MKRAGDILSRAREQMQSAAYGSKFYQKLLASDDTKLGLTPLPVDPWPGDSQTGMALTSGQMNLAGQSFSAKPMVWYPPTASPGWIAAAHGFGWLRDLRAAGGAQARTTARTLVADWLDHCDVWHPQSWAPATLGTRLASWVSFHDIFAEERDGPLQARLLASLARQMRHLLRQMNSGQGSGGGRGLSAFAALRGLIYAALTLTEETQDHHQRALTRAMALLRQRIGEEILPDGGHIEKSPDTHLQVLQALTDIRAALAATGVELPDDGQAVLDTTIARMLPALRLYRHGDGALALFHGGQEQTALMIDAVMTQAGFKGRTLKSLPQTGYERLTAGRALLLVDTSAPPPRGHDRLAHTGILAFEFSVGRERLIVNCGAHATRSANWRQALAATAAHSTLVVEDRNACAIDAVGLDWRGGRASRVTAHRYEQDRIHFIDASHDFYQPGHGVTVRRVLALAPEGDKLEGRETIAGRTGKRFTLRFHLHPAVQSSLIQNGQAVLLRLPGGGGWRFRCRGGAIALEPSIYCGAPDAPRRAVQICVSGRIDAEEASGEARLEWSLAREKS